MKKCPRCGQEVRDDEKFCPHCGLDLQARYRPIKQKNKSMTYLLYVIIFFSFITIPLLYGRLLSNLGNDFESLDKKERIELKEVTDSPPTAIIGTFDTLADFNKQFSNVETTVQSIQTYEKQLEQKSQYTFDKDYHIAVLDNNNIYYTLTYSVKINEHLSMVVEKQFDRSHTYNTEKVSFKKTGITQFDDLFFHDEENTIVHRITGNQNVTDQLMNDFSKRKEEFEAKKKKIGHYGIGNYDGRSSFVVYRQNETFYSQLTYMTDTKEYID